MTGLILVIALGGDPSLSDGATVSQPRTLHAINTDLRSALRREAVAKTMADRDHAAFESFLSEEAVFLSGTSVQRGRDAVASHWKAYFAGPEPPFSWEPETVSVLESGELAISTGPVWNARRERTSTFTSIWRQEEPGVWRIIFDKGDKFCE